MTGIAAPIIVLDPDVAEARLLAGWLRSAGLGRIAVARTCDEALFLLGRSNADLLIIDEGVSPASEQRLLLHIAACGHAPPPAIVRLLAEGSADPVPRARARTAETVRKPLEAHDAVVRVGMALQRPDLVGRLDSNRDQSNAHIDMARGMQLALLPTEGQLDALQSECGVGLAGLCRSGEAVGGDFWGAWPTGEGGFALTVADFAGHGLSAALNTFRLHAILDEQTLPRGQPSRMTDLLNRRLHSLLQRGQYATMIYAQIEPASGCITWCSAGGPPPMFVSPGGMLDLAGRGLPLGVKPDAAYSQSQMNIAEGGLLCLFSDGLYEGGLGSPDIEREEIGAVLSGPAALAAAGRLREAAGLAIVELEKLRDRHVCLEHSDDVMVVCAALAGVE